MYFVTKLNLNLPEDFEAELSFLGYDLVKLEDGFYFFEEDDPNDIKLLRSYLKEKINWRWSKYKGNNPFKITDEEFEYEEENSLL